MKKSLFCILFMLGVSLTILAQELSPTVITTSGGMEQTERVFLEWTLGELACNSIYSKNKIYTEGFHQPILKIERVDETTLEQVSFQHLHDRSSLEVKVFPNPTSQYLNIDLYQLIDLNIEYSIYGSDGQIIHKEVVEPSCTNLKIDMATYSNGLYYLLIQDLTHLRSKTYKITKIQ